jgi:2-dehydro-3-deoxy-D-arabinonate dehydratase
VKIFRTMHHAIIESGGVFRREDVSRWDALINSDDHLSLLSNLTICSAPEAAELLAPIGSQEVWAAGVTYHRSRDARVKESGGPGVGDFYTKVYEAQRPELFFKAPAYRVVGPGGRVRIRRDATWSVPEPELTLVINHCGSIVGYSIGNDMSSRDIEGENPLYLPQAKMYDGSCALGPCVYLTREPFPLDTKIQMNIHRKGAAIFSGATQVRNIRRSFTELAEYLYRETSYPHGCLLMTGTGIVPPDDFTLQSGDEVEITIDPIGCLRNIVA